MPAYGGFHVALYGNASCIAAVDDEAVITGGNAGQPRTGLYTVCDELNRTFTSPSFRQLLIVEPEKFVPTMPARLMPSVL